ncbi:MAG TPA: TolC family protein [Polyangia bacterium]|nr:TolC family protein [Polyangia bacterium]
MNIRLAWLPALLVTSVAAAEPRPLTPQEAVELAVRFDPVVAEARVAKDRADLGVLRAQLDRISLRIDGSLQELYNQSNIGGRTQYTCTVVINGVEQSFVTSDPDNCRNLGGTATVLSTASGQGLLNLSARLDLPLFTGFRVTSNIKRAQLTRDSSVVAIRQARRDTALTVARAYWSIRRIDLLRQVQEQALSRLREAEAVTDARVLAGVTPPIDRNRARLRRVQQESTLADLVGQTRESVAQLAVSLGLTAHGVDPATDLALVDAPSFPEAGPPPVEDLLVEAQRGRAEVERARLQVAVQQQVVRGLKSAYYPQLGGLVLFQLGNNLFSVGQGASSVSNRANPFSNVTGQLTIGGSLAINFFDTLRTYTGVKDAQYELRRLEEEHRRMKLVVESDVRSAHARVGKLYERRAVLLQARDVARDNLIILQGRYQNGEALVIEYLDAQIDLVNTEMQLADLTAQLQLAWIELEAALGRVVGAHS